jgi:formylglycine-generating enzyme required for sulfatase activity
MSARVASRYGDVTENDVEVPREFDDYVIGRELGRGTTGAVYLAEDAMLARPVAIKFIAKLDPGARQQFLLEARAIAQIHHPNVVGIYRIGAVDCRPYLVTELVRGTSLAKLDKPVPHPAALGIAIDIARGLAAAHRRNVVHCDLKPSNVMIDPDGAAKIIDFGLARVAVDGARAGGLPVGTPDYMAPEVWSGEAPSRRADVYSLGALLFELLSGAPPFADVAPAELRHRVTTGEIPVLRDRAPDIEPALAKVVERCLRRDRDARFADADEVREALERLQAPRHHAMRPGENPYRGLLPFEASHRGVFFGRRSEIDAVVARLCTESIVLVTGDSGVGKSSLCRAGVLPTVLDGALGGAWQVLTIVPGRQPLDALASAIGDPGLASRLRETPALLPRELRRYAGDRGLILFIDQLEELLTTADLGEVTALDAGLAELAEGVRGLRVLATARADFLAGLSVLPGLGRDLSRLLYFLRPLPPERLRDVIVGPAAAVGTQFESDAIIDDLIAATAQAGSGGLPLLSFALADLWEARDRERELIARSAVTTIGGIAGVLSRHADDVLHGMIPPDRVRARRLLLRLVTAMGTRVRRPEHELALDDSVPAVLNDLVRGRLVVVHDGDSEPVYEIAHECLITGWPALQNWLDADAAGRATRERLAGAVAEWVRLGRRGDATWQGTRLDEAADLDPDSLSPDERAFVAASHRVARRQIWRRGLAVFGSVVLAVLALWTERYLAQRKLAAVVADELVHARGALAAAHDADRKHAELQAQAFREFDDAHWDIAEALWKDMVVQREAAGRAYSNASGHAESAFAKDPTRADVRDLIGDVLLDRAVLADDAHDRRLRDESIERLAYYDADGSRHARWAARGRVVVHAPAGAAITLDPDRSLGSGSAERWLSPGSYRLSIAMPGRVLVHAPILVERGRALTVEIAPPPRIEDVPAGFVYIPAGEFLYGNADDATRLSFFQTTPQRRRRTEAFLIARTEVTFGDYLAYLDTLPPNEQKPRLPSVSSLAGNLAVTRDAAGRWQLALQPQDHRYIAAWDQPMIYPGRARRAVQDWRRFPVLGVSGLDATAYAVWLDHPGRVPGARLCSEVEWERAARGADDRPYPGGRTPGPDDADFDATYTLELMGPDEVGSHPASRSPFEIDDMAGNAFEWTLSEQGGYVLRGGSYRHDLRTDDLTNRSPAPGTNRDVALGIRLCATPPLPR